MKNLEFKPTDSKLAVFALIEAQLADLGYEISSKDMDRPWGGFLVLDENQIKKFMSDFFPQVELTSDQIGQKLSPKFLIVAPKARLSWQYHFRRAELWSLIAGRSAISRSDSDSQGPVKPMEQGEVVFLEKGERHRLIGTDTWGIVAEIWMHADATNPSDESDIVRLQDDYARK